MHKIVMSAGVIACAICAATAFADAQTPSFVGTWRSQATMAGTGGYGVLVNMEDVFQPDGKFSSLTSSYYTNGPAAGRQIGAVQASGTYRVDTGQSVIGFHATQHSSTAKTVVPTDEYDRYRFTSAVTFALQSLNGGPVVTFRKIQ